MKARISVTGDLKEFAVALEGARKAVDRESLLQALEAGGAMVQESVQRQVSGKAKSHPGAGSFPKASRYSDPQQKTRR